MICNNTKKPARKIFGRYNSVLFIAFLLLYLPTLFSCTDNREISSENLTVTEINLFPETETSGETVDNTDVPNDSTPISVIANEYSVIYGNDAPPKVQSAAQSLTFNIKNSLGATLEAVTDTLPSTNQGKEILIGLTNRAESIEAAKPLNYMDYTIRINKSKIVIVGGSPLATEQAVKVFSDMLFDGTITALDTEFVYDYDFDRYISNSLAYNTKSFVPKWADEFTPPAWMLDYEEKVYSITSPNGRISSISHRGDVQHYPENSLEAILSAIMMGADIIEIDIRLTKDNIMVLMHDETLKRTTDWQYQKGKNGLPTSDRVEDWTYEQLRELHLVYRGKLTYYRIPTAYEAVLLCADRVQIHFDCKVSDRIDRNTDVYLLAEETGTKNCFLFCFGNNTMRTWLSKDDSDTEFKAFVKKSTSYLLKREHALRKSKFDLLAKYGDHPNGWKNAWNEGYKAVFTDKIYDFCRYAAENEVPLQS